MEAPRRHYVADLVHHYQLGISGDSPMLQYLSYYHVAEHWFENVYQDDLIDRVQALITAPGFSYRRKQDVRSLIRNVTKAVQLRDEELAINNEQAALTLTLNRFVNISDLNDDIRRFDAALPELYASHTVSFSGGDPVDLNSTDAQGTLVSLSRRIYKTRNALVHSKEGSKGRFVPFTHDNELAREIPLMRFVAERIIIATSKVISQ
nr:hypothetical protein GCM10020063_094990 [Dactylosporangium thailandense]